MKGLRMSKKKCELCATKATIEDVSAILGFQIEWCPKCGKSLDQQTKTLEERRQEFIEAVRPFVTEENKKELSSFVKYWSATSSNRAQKMAFEKQKSWNVKARIATWLRNQKSWSISAQLRKGKKDYE